MSSTLSTVVLSTLYRQTKEQSSTRRMEKEERQWAFIVRVSHKSSRHHRRLLTIPPSHRTSSRKAFDKSLTKPKSKFMLECSPLRFNICGREREKPFEKKVLLVLHYNPSGVIDSSFFFHWRIFSEWLKMVGCGRQTWSQRRPAAVSVVLGT